MEKIQEAQQGILPEKLVEKIPTKSLSGSLHIRSEEARRAYTYTKWDGPIVESPPVIIDKQYREDVRRAVDDATDSFRKTLTKKQHDIFETHVLPYLEQFNRHKDKAEFDLSIAQRWIFQRVMDLGWTVQKFGRFDRAVTMQEGTSRFHRKVERIGKKYQWIAYFEFLAMVSDNFEFTGESSNDVKKEYDGPWQVGYIRDIDPSLIRVKTYETEDEIPRGAWWIPCGYESWLPDGDDHKWLKEAKDLPDPKTLMEVQNPQDSSSWFLLESFIKWEQPVPPGEERYKTPRRELWYMLKSYLVRKADIEEIFAWAKKQNFMGRWMPESSDLSSVFLGEFPWAPAFLGHLSPYYGQREWTRGYRGGPPQEVLVASDQYFWEGGNDNSVKDTVRIYLPAHTIVAGMQLTWRGREGQFFDKRGNLIAFDPSVDSRGPGSVVIRKEEFLEFLRANGYEIFWTLLGKKNRIGSGIINDFKGRLEINGVYRTRGGRIEGSLRAKFIPPPDGKKVKS